jgi:hypothetical protein
MYIQDFRRLLRRLGCLDYRVAASKRITIGNAEVEQRVGRIEFTSMTIRAFKLASLEDICEDYGQVAYYLGTIPDHPWSFTLDDHHTFSTGKPVPVCGNTAAMVGETRYGDHFKVIGDRAAHFGPFDCSPVPPGRASDENCRSGCC